MTIEHLGTAGHFCAADRCRYHLHTHVNGFCVSTVGDYYSLSDVRTTLGADPDSWYETMVFKLVDGDHDGQDIYCERYATGAEADVGHRAAVLKFEKDPTP